jgi:hypothetical protein
MMSEDTSYLLVLNRDGDITSAKPKPKYSMIDPARVCMLVFVWLGTIIGVSVFANIFASEYFSFGPSERIKMFSWNINNWYKWSAVTVYVVINQFIQTLGLEVITPWMISSVQNKQVYTLDYKPAITQIIIQIWYIYMWVSRIISIQLLLSQIDFLLLVLVVDLSTTLYTTHAYISAKSDIPKRFSSSIL